MCREKAFWKRGIKVFKDLWDLENLIAISETRRDAVLIVNFLCAQWTSMSTGYSGNCWESHCSNRRFPSCLSPLVSK